MSTDIKILIVDDESFNVRYLEGEVEELGYSSSYAYNGKEALEWIAKEPPDLILLDILMPVMDGFALLQELRSQGATRDIPVIIVSALNDLANLVKGIELGANDYMTKPIEPALLAVKIEACLQKKLWEERERRYLERLAAYEQAPGAAAEASEHSPAHSWREQELHETLSLPEGTALRDQAEGVQLRIPRRNEPLRLGPLSPLLRQGLEALLSHEGARREALWATEDPEQKQLHAMLSALERSGMLQLHLWAGPRRMCTFEGLTHFEPAPAQDPPKGLQVRLSPTAFLRPLQPPRVRAEIPFSPVALVLHHPGLLEWLLSGAQVRPPQARLYERLRHAGFVFDPHRHERWRHWEFHDLLLHHRSRIDGSPRPYGITYPHFYGQEPYPEAIQTAGAWLQKIALPIPEKAPQEPALDQVVEARRSVREQGEAPLSLEQLSAFLYRSARVTHESTLSLGPHELETTQRLYPSGGACYDLEIYLLIHSCSSVPQGLYHYQPKEHALYQLTKLQEPCGQMLELAGHQMGNRGRAPQILLCITSRILRIAWKYESLSYAMALKNLGVLYEAMYLSATALGLAPCALGGGNSRLFAEASGLDQAREPMIGEFALGSIG